MNEHQHIDAAIKSLLEGGDAPAPAQRGRTLAQQRLDGVINQARQPRRRRIARPRLIVTLACALVLVTGVALATTTGFADRILRSKEPAANRIGVIRDDPRPDMTQAELIATFQGSFVKQQIGDHLQGQISAPLVQDDRARLSARRTAEGAVCTELFELTSFKKGEPATWHLSMASCGTFENGWPLMGGLGLANNFTGPIAFGLIADGVVQVRFIVDGKTLNATMGTSAYLWRPPHGAKPSDIEAVLTDGTVVRRDLTWAYSGSTHGPP